LVVDHQVIQVFFQSVYVEFFQLFTIIKISTHRLGFAVVLIENGQVQGARPPFHIAAAGGGIAAVHDRAFARRWIAISHIFSPLLSGILASLKDSVAMVRCFFDVACTDYKAAGHH
jgi:hypothetical protein